MIKWCIGIWDEDNTVYVAESGLTPLLYHAILYDEPKGYIHPIMNWLPVFMIDDLINSEE